MKLNWNRPNLISFSLKLVFILIFPLQFYVEDIINILVLPTSGFLFTPLRFTPEYLAEITWAISSYSVYLRNFVIGLLIAIPGIFFNYKLTRAPVNKSYWWRGVGTAICLYGLVFATMMFLSILSIGPIGSYSYYNESNYMLMQRLRFYASLVFGVFIILPLVQRQAVIIGSPKYLHDYSMHDLESNPKLSLSREKILSGILWISLCFAPYTIGNSMYYYYGGIPFSGLLMSFYFGSHGGIRFDSYSNFFSIAVSDFTFLPFLAFICIFQFMFVRDVYRYLRKSVTRQRLIAMALLSSFAPLLLSTSVISSIFYFMISSLIPIPILQIVGFLVIKYHRPIADEVDRVWEEDAHRMWWEKPHEKSEPAISTPEKPQRNRDGEIITVPVHYLLLSKIRSLNHRRK